MSLRIFQHANYPFLQWSRRAVIVSAVALGIGVVAMIVNVVSIGSWLDYGVDFTGGTRVVVRVAEGVGVEEIRDALGGDQSLPISQFGAENEFTIRVPPEGEQDPDAAVNEVMSALEGSPAIGEFEVLEREFVGPTIGNELQWRALLAMLISFGATLIYLAIRFEFRFGLAAVIATVHDILLTLGFMALMRLEVSLPAVAAILTVIGYSLNDKIVVFDRIRENLNKKGGRRENPAALINRSVNEVLPRTCLTGGATLGVLVVLSVLAGTVIRDFALILLVGIIIGTYSSMFIGAPALVEIQKRLGTKEEADRKKARKRETEEAVPV
jgi:preprotein translocase subunit SecF